jgi:hypothetical protein
MRRKEITMENRLDQSARGATRAAAWREGLRRLGRRRVPAKRVDRSEAQPFDFDALAKEVAQGLSRREVLRRLGVCLGGALLAALGLEGRAWGTPSTGGGDNNCGAHCQVATNYPTNPAHKAAFTDCVTACDHCHNAGKTACFAPGGAVACCSSGQTCCTGLNRAACCSAGQTCCSGACHTVSTDPNNCGACGVVCASGGNIASSSCVGGSCAYTCATGYATCDTTICGTRLGTTAHCGGCGDACATGATITAASCQSGSCTYTCASGSATCDPSSPCGTNLNTNPNHCGTCGEACASGGNIVAASCIGGSCSYTCVTGYDTCDPGTPCGTYPDTDPNNCGACGTACASGGNIYASSCTLGICDYECYSPYATCDSGNYCGTQLGTLANCAGCGDACAPRGDTCSFGMCECGNAGSTCSPGQLCCGAKCIDQSVNNCGACGMTCTGSQVCSGGRCCLPPGAALPGTCGILTIGLCCDRNCDPDHDVCN